MADDVEQQVIAEILGTPLNTFSIQLDESTDISSCAQLLVFARSSKTGTSRKSSYFAIAWKQPQKEMFSSRSLITLIEWDYPERMFQLAQQMVLLLCLEFIRDFELRERQ
ncbi:hypothetical protein LOD99_8001 [Oopsacas minuta]|uniref:Uncharacterized protein n=1 Tax=Oopsacas minuta TaxID=111878 RepID=A0AAV7JIH6_9METZ|nr:hypothetical protein LOD99_8001 [Oopsacas minuta]